jgi:hypothetical protein
MCALSQILPVPESSLKPRHAIRTAGHSVGVGVLKKPGWLAWLGIPRQDKTRQDKTVTVVAKRAQDHSV